MVSKFDKLGDQTNDLFIFRSYSTCRFITYRQISNISRTLIGNNSFVKKKTEVWRYTEFDLTEEEVCITRTP